MQSLLEIVTSHDKILDSYYSTAVLIVTRVAIISLTHTIINNVNILELLHIVLISLFYYFFYLLVLLHLRPLDLDVFQVFDRYLLTLYFLN